MFKELGMMAGLMRQLPKIREEMEKFQSSLAQMTAEGSAGGGMVTAVVNGHKQLLRCSLSEQALALQDREMLEELIVAAVNQAMEKIMTVVQEESQKMAAGLGLPPGLGLPGLG